jgi:hypothetical protein
MQQALENQGLTYEPTRGKYGKPEQSFIVHVNDPSHVEAALGLAKRFGQEAVVYSTGGKHQLVWVNGPNEGQATSPSEGHDFYDAEPEDNYTMIPGPNGEPHGFMAYHLNLNDPPQPFGAPVSPPEAAKAVVKAAVDAYNDILMGLRMRELKKADEKAAARGPQVHTFKTTARAYDASQTSDDIHPGDVLHVPGEGVTGILMDAWPVAVHSGESSGEFHKLDPNGPAKGDWKTIDGGKWLPSVELATKVHRGEHPAPAPGMNDTVAGIWQEREKAFKSENTMKLTDLIKSQVAKAPAANGGAISVSKSESETIVELILGKAEPLKKPMESQAQAAAMHAAAAGKSKLGIPKSVGKEFVEASHGQKVGKLPEHKKAQCQCGQKGCQWCDPVKKAEMCKSCGKMHKAEDMEKVTPEDVPESVVYKLKEQYGYSTPEQKRKVHATAWKIHHEKTKKAEVVSAESKKNSGGHIVQHSIWKKAEVCPAPDANGGDIVVGKAEVKAGYLKANGGRIRLGKQEWMIDLAHVGHDEKRMVDHNPVKGAKGFEDPKKVDPGSEKERGTSSQPKGNEPRDPKDQKNGASELLAETSAPGGKQDGANSVKGKGDAKGGGTDIYDSVKGKKAPASEKLIVKAEEEPEGYLPTEEDEGYKDCPACGGPAGLGGVLGNRKHYNCRNCGMWFSHKPKDVEKKETMATPKAPGMKAQGSPKLGAAAPKSTSPAKAPMAPAMPPAMKAENISAVPASPSLGPAGNTAITSVGKSEAQTLILQTLKKKEQEFTPEQLGGHAGEATPALAGPRKFSPGGPTVAGMAGAPAKGGAMAAGLSPKGVRGAMPRLAPAGMPAARSGVINPAVPAPAAAKPATAAMTKPMGVAAPSRAPAADLGRKARVAAQDVAMMGGKGLGTAKVTVKKEVASAPKENGGQIAKGKAMGKAEMCKSCGKMSKMCKCAK